MQIAHDTMDPTKPAYTFKPLEHERSIRILVLHPATHDDEELVAHMEHQERRTAKNEIDVQQYDAISYTWGAPVMDRILVCDGSTLAITENVDVMLRRLRKTRFRRLWIDAICLNQADNAEKRLQVPLMSEIYREASKVLIWLGDATPTEEQAVDAIRKLNLVGMEQLAVDQEAKTVLFNMLARPWFTRRWILQEAIAHANTKVILGSKSLSWIELMHASRKIQYSSSQRHAPRIPAFIEATVATLKALHDLPSRSRSGSPHSLEHPLLELISLFSNSECFDPRDRVNALIGLLRQSTTWLPDYSAHWTEEYERLARMTLREEHGFEVIEWHLRKFGSIRNSNPNCPAWVPDWSQSRRSRATPGTAGMDVIAFADARGLKREADISTRLNEHLNSLWSCQFLCQARWHQERYKTSDGSLRIIPREAHGDPASLLTTLLSTPSQYLNIDFRNGDYLGKALAILLLQLMPVRDLYREHLNMTWSKDKGYLELFRTWFESLLEEKSSGKFKFERYSWGRLTLGDASFINDVIVTCLVEIFNSHTVFWAWKQGSRRQKPRLGVGIIKATKFNLDDVAFHSLEATASVEEWIVYKNYAFQRGEALLGMNMTAQAAYVVSRLDLGG